MITVNQKIHYAIMSAMPEETNFFHLKFSNCDAEKVVICELIFNIYHYRNTKVLVCATGIGTAFGASILTLIQAHFNPNFYFFCGTAGGIKKGLQLRDVVIGEFAFEAEIQELFTMVKETPFETCLKHPLKNEYFPPHYPASTVLLAIGDSLYFSNIKIHKGTMVSSNAFPAPTELFEKIKQYNPCSIDMETSAFYQIAWLLNLKVLAIRGISNVLSPDGTDENIDKSDVLGSSLAASSVLLAILNKTIDLRLS